MFPIRLFHIFFISALALMVGSCSVSDRVSSVKKVSGLGVHQTLGAVSRPVSSGYRLLTWTKDTAYEFLNPSVLMAMGNTPPGPLAQTEPMNLVEFESELDAIVGKDVQLGSMEFLIGGVAFFTRLEEAIKEAKHSIDVRIFIFDNDDYALKIADLLKAKSNEPDIKVRVLLDGIGTFMGEEEGFEHLPPGYTPPDSIAKYLVTGSNIELRTRPNVFLKADHIKTIVIDEEVAFTGGMNIGREYRYVWHDMMMEVNGPVVHAITDEFEKAWAHASKWGDLILLAQMITNNTQASEGDGYPIRLLFTRANNPEIYRAQLAAIKRAKNYIYIHNSYFSNNAILYELIRARRRGVDVRVILPAQGNHAIMNASNAVTANILFKNGIRVFFYPKMSHIKAAIYDGWLCTGTANFDKLSLKDNLELNLATSEQEIVNDLKESLFEKDFKVSLEMDELLDAGIKETIAEFIANHL